MRAVIQRVTAASVTIAGTITGQINAGLLVLVGIEPLDSEVDAAWLAKKIVQLRIFNDANSVPNLSLGEINGQILVVSQFTLFASTRKGNRPSYLRAARPEIAVPLYEFFLQTLATESNTTIQAGVFGADMQVQLCNDGPITIIIDTQNKE
jgi:D-aminoacyl-tRNA deacylase